MINLDELEKHLHVYNEGDWAGWHRDELLLIITELRAAREVIDAYKNNQYWNSVMCPMCNSGDWWPGMTCFCDDQLLASARLEYALTTYNEAVEKEV